MENNNIINSTEASRESFWSLLKDKAYTIYIPRIQRDYAQGRNEPEPTQIRQTFLRDVFGALEADEALDVNFIYGNIDTDKKGTNRFVPIDGQQRLTTLFLLHWYFATWSGKLTDENKVILNRFQYETRFITGDFCNRLVNEVQINLRELNEHGGDIVSAIKDYYWFFSTYDHNATIDAMLVMLKEINDFVINLDDPEVIDTYFDKLISSEKLVSFLFLNIADVGLTDEIYIKMNARGKALTRFENFKAQLTAYLSNIDEDFSNQFIGKINGEWSQFFWYEEYRPIIESGDDKKNKKRSIVFDDQIMNLFRFIMMNEYITNVKIDEGSTETKYTIRGVLRRLSEENDFQFVNHLFTDEFRNIAGNKTDEANVDSRVFKYIDRLLNVLSKRKSETGSICFLNSELYDKVFFDEESFFKRLIRATSEKPLAYEDQILLYAEYSYLVKYSNEDGSFDKTDELTEWVRYIYNLTRNMLYNGWDDYFRSVRRLRKIIDNGAESILEYASKLLRREYRQGSGYGFVENQMTEESIKANLLLMGPQWRRLIIRAENSFLGSQIAALLSFSDIWGEYEGEMSSFEKDCPDAEALPSADYILSGIRSDKRYEESFELYLEKFNMIFEKDNIRPNLEKNSLLRRALLTFGGADSYMLPAGKPVKCFLDATDRDTSFRRLFRGDSAKNRQYFKELLDCIDINKDIEEQLDNIIFHASYDDSSRWKQYFIEMPEILECMYQNKESADPTGKFVFRSPKRFICMRSADQILLLERTMTTSINREYYSYVLYLKLSEDGYKVDYFTTFSENTEKYVIYTNKQEKEIQIVYSEDTDGYKYMARENGIITYKGDLDHMMDYVHQSIKE